MKRNVRKTPLLDHCTLSVFRYGQTGHRQQLRLGRRLHAKIEFNLSKQRTAWTYLRILVQRSQRTFSNAEASLQQPPPW